MLDGKSFDVINPVQEDMPEPQFKKFKDAGVNMRTNAFMTHPILNEEGELCLNVQIMAREKKNAKGKHKLYAGFTNFDEVFFGIFSAFIQAKV